MFKLHPQLAQDCRIVGDLSLCRVLLVNDQQYPWLILVPRREGVEEIFQLSLEDQQQLLLESSAVTELLAGNFAADKMNVAALGNMVPQLHVHHIVRFRDDAAWPKPVWGVVPAVAYDELVLQELLERLRSLIQAAGLVFSAEE